MNNPYSLLPIQLGKGQVLLTPVKTAPQPAIELQSVARPAVDSSRKLTLLKRTGFFGADLRGCTIERACEAADLRAAYQLVHNVFVGTGYIKPEKGGIRLRIFEATADTATFVAKKDGVVVGVLSVVPDTAELGLPSDTAFKEELDSLRATGARLCEITNQAVTKEFRSSSVLTELMRCAIAYMIQAGYDRALATVSPNHKNFYNLVGFQSLGSLRSYSDKLHDPVVAIFLSIDLYRSAEPAEGIDPAVHRHAATANPFLASATDWTRRARQRFLSTDVLSNLLVTGRNFLSECTPAELSYLRKSWGANLFDQIMDRPTISDAKADDAPAHACLAA
ncbi:MAG: GNAT family N-acetyltransferase [Burkholderiales bacterium]|nr:GNAT family N-acetyltransferase [Opitutaceae bacterium]